jgi:hypothetical protein
MKQPSGSEAVPISGSHKYKLVDSTQMTCQIEDKEKKTTYLMIIYQLAAKFLQENRID